MAARAVTDVSAQLRQEYLALPGLNLTLDQATRLCGVDRTTCLNALDALIREGFLRCSVHAYCDATQYRRAVSSGE
jgi:hypothetical protein